MKKFNKLKLYNQIYEIKKDLGIDKFCYSMAMERKFKNDKQRILDLKILKKKLINLSKY